MNTNEFRNQDSFTMISEEADSKKESNDGASIEVARRRRGRPSGSKNKPKSPPVFITKQPEPTMSPYLIQVSSGSDIIAAVTRFCNNRQTGLCILSGSGTASNVSFRQPITTMAVIFPGVYDLLTISATLLPSTSATLTSCTNKDFLGKFVVSMAGPKGHVFGGVVVGPLIAAGTVNIVAASFNDPLYHRLPMENEDQVRSCDGGHASTSTTQSHDFGDIENGRYHGPPSTAAESLSMYNFQLQPSQQQQQVIWPPSTPTQPLRNPSFFLTEDI